MFYILSLVARHGDCNIYFLRWTKGNWETKIANRREYIFDISVLTFFFFQFYFSHLQNIKSIINYFLQITENHSNHASYLVSLIFKLILLIWNIVVYLVATADAGDPRCQYLVRLWHLFVSLSFPDIHNNTKTDIVVSLIFFYCFTYPDLPHKHTLDK